MQANISNNSSANELAEIQEKVNEAELYLTQGLFEEARQIYQEILNELGSLADKGAADPALLQSYKSQRTFIQEQLATIDRQEAEFHGLAPEAPAEQAAAPQKEEGNAAFNRGQAFLDIGMFADAINEFQRAAELGFQPTECSLQIGKAYLQLGQHGEGIRVLKQTYKRKDLSDTERNLVLAQLAVGFETAGDKEEALQLYQKLAERDPKHLTAAKKVKSLAKEGDRYYFNMVKLHLKNKQFSKAIKTLRQMEKENQASVAEVMPLYEQILEKDPGNKEAIEQITSIYGQMLDNGGGGVDTRLKFARLLLRAGEFDRAANEYLEVMLEDTPYKITALNELGEALLERQDYDRILELLEDAVPWVESLDPGPETLNYYVLLGKACERKSLYDQARSYFQRAAEIDPTHEAIKVKGDTQTEDPLLSRGKTLLRLRVNEDIQYQIQEKIGEDTLHQFFKVREVPSGSLRVAKSLSPALSAEITAKDFMVKWGYEQVNMENRNITRVLDVAERGKHYYLITEDFDSTLDDLLKKKTSLTIKEAVRLARALLNGLAYAHSHRGSDDTLRKIFHLGLNPKRILIRGELSNAKIADFGLISKLGIELGFTLDYKELSAYELTYMAPELFNRAPARMPDKMKQAADLYSFGLVFYRALTGKVPFEGPSPEDFKKQHNEQYPVP
ncbi:MAG: tetratricopeptide repeat protein, partial [Deltaproteobacteria bacterium]|nr:tetratricopeptide repeat protein [Deltaproteobacteria bacterium]